MRKWLAAAMCVVSIAAHAAWVSSAAPGAASLALGSEPGEMALASQARVLAVGTEDRASVKVVNPDTGAVSGTIALDRKPVSLALNANATRLYVLQDGRKVVYVYDVASRTQVASWNVDGELVAVALRSGGSELLVADKDGKRLVALNPATGALLRQKALPSKPVSLSVSAADTRILVATADGRLISLNTTNLDIVSNVPLGDEARSVSFWDRAGLAVVVQKKSDAVSLVNIESGSVVARVEVSTDPDRAAVDDAGAKAYVSTGDDLGVSQIDLASRRSDGRFILPARAAAVLFDPVARVIYVSQAKDKLLLRINPAQHPLLSDVTLAKRLRDIAFNDRTHEAATIAEKANELSRVRFPGHQVDSLGLPDRPSLIAVDSQRNVAAIAFKKEIRFADFASYPPALLAGNVALPSEVVALAVDSVRGLTLAVSKKADDDPRAQSAVHLIDNTTRARLASVSSRENLQALAVDSRRGLGYLLAGSKKLVTLDIATRAFTRTTTLAFQADAIAVDEELNVAVLTDASRDQAYIIDLATGATIQQFDVPRGPVAVAVRPNSHLAVIASKEADQLSLINLATRSLTAGYAIVDSPFALATSLRFNLALVLSGEKDEITLVPLPNAVPQLSALAPAQVTAGAAQFTLTATGAGFVDSSRVLLGSTQLETRWIGPDKLEATVPAPLVAEARSVNVFVRTPGPGGGDSNAMALVIVAPVPPLAILAISPASGPVGTNVTLIGTSFDAVAANNQVFFTGSGSTTVAASVVSATATQLVVIVPPGAQTGPITVTNSRGTATSTPFTVTIALAITAIAPTSGLAGTQVTLTGTGFDPVAANNQVSFRGAGTATVPASIVSASSTQLVVLVPAGAESGPITVTNSRGSASSSTFTVLAPLTVGSITPSSGLAGSQVTIAGTGFDPIAANNQVAFKGPGTTSVAASIVSATATQLVVGVPAGAETGPITVTNARGTATSTVFTVIPPPPAITAIDPASGPPLTLVTITGTGFAAGAANNTVAFNGMSATVLSATATNLVVRVPSGAATGTVTVSNAYGNVTGPVFTVQPPLETDAQLLASPASIEVYQGAAGSVQIQLGSTGTDTFTGVASLSVSGLPAGVTGTFKPAASLSAFQPGTLVLSAADGAATGDFTVTVTAATEGAEPITRTARFALRMLPGAGVTGIKGRFVTPAGEGIAGVVVRADNGAATQPQTTTDTAGNFQLVGLDAGAYTLRFDATAANPLYPIWPYSITVIASKIAVIPDWTINPPPADDKFTPIANTGGEQVITDARFPGLEIRLPAGATITGWDGVRKSRIAVEKVDIAKLPVSPPPSPTGSAYQLYFGTPMGGIPSQPIPVTLPNDVDADPGQSVDIWFFDGSPMGGSGEWKIAGQGIVSADGKRISMPNGTGIPRFCGVCGLMCPGKQPPAPNPPPGPPPPCDGNPVDLALGQEMPKSRGMSCGGLTPIDAGMSYNPVDAFNGVAGTAGSVGFGWTLDYDISFLPFEGPQKRLILPGNNRVNFVDSGTGIYRVVEDPRFDGATISAIGGAAANRWELRFKDGRIWRFSPYPGVGGVIRNGVPTFVNEMIDAQGNLLSINRQSQGRIVSVGTADRNISLTYGANGFASEMRDTASRVTRFAYTPTDRLSSVTDPDNRVTSYTYVDDNEFPPAPAACGTITSLGERLKTVSYPGRPLPTVNHYGPGHRVIRQVGYDGREFRFNYRLTGACVTHTSNPNAVCSGPTCPDVDSWENFQAGWRIRGGIVVSTTVIQPDGQTYSSEFNAQGTATSMTNTLGQKSATKLDSMNRPIEQTDPLGRTTKYSYDANGNISQIIDPLGRITRIDYHPVWNKPTVVTQRDDAGQPVVWSYAYHAGTGVLLSKTNPLNQTISMTYTSRGQLETIVNPLGKVTRFEYDVVGDLVKSIDPLLLETRHGYDGAGRRTSLTTPMTFVTRTAYDGISHITRITDARNKDTNLGYDPAGRLQSVTNARGIAIESYGYDGGDRVISRTNALSKSMTFQHDASGRLSRTTDRKNQVTTFGYDGEDRLVSIDRPEGRTQVTYDIVGRLIGAVDPVSSTTYGYDAVDRLVSEKQVVNGVTTTVRYQFDALDRRISRTVTGAVNETTSYGYDGADRLIRISHRGQDTTVEYDAGGRPIRKVMPNGIVQTIGYDDADRLTGLTYANPDGSVIEQLTYGYDDNGRRITETRASPPSGETPFTATYDNADRMTSITLTNSGQTFDLAYDDNGNLLSKVGRAGGPTTTYTWDSQNRLIALNGPGAVATFQYDSAGRRVSRIVNGEATRYVYDGMQSIAEIRASGSESLLTALGMDEVIARYSTSGSRVFLTDGLNTVLAQTKEDRSRLNSYLYSAYGESVSQGPDEGNDVQYTGRENDGTGLYFYRARYYDPVLKRFVSEDPIGLQGGFNLFSYVHGNPVAFSDPSGKLLPLLLIPVFTGIVGGVTGGVGNYLVQRYVQGKCNVSWGEVLNAAGWGAAAGAALPAVGVTIGGAAVVGVVANVGQYGFQNVMDGTSPTWGGFGWTVTTGAVGGAAGGAFNRVAPWGMSRTGWPEMAHNNNVTAGIGANAGVGNLSRNAGGGLVGNMPQPGDGGGGGGGCPCKR